MEIYFVLDDQGEPRLENNMDEWRCWFHKADRRIARTNITPEVTVLTIFRGVAETEEAPLLFETRVFGGLLNGEEARCHTKTEAQAKHAELVALSKMGNTSDVGFSEKDFI